MTKNSSQKKPHQLIKKIDSNDYLFGIIILLLVLLGYASYHLSQNTLRLDNLENKRYHSNYLADKIQDDSELLTKYARMYVITEDSTWIRKYYKVLNLPIEKKPYEEASLLTLTDTLYNLELTDDEFAILNRAQELSNELTWIEIVAFNAINGIYADALGEFTELKEPDKEFAINILHNEEYIKAAKAIVEPIGEMTKKLNKRIDNEENTILRENNYLKYLVILCVILIAIISFYALIKNRKLLQKQLSEYLTLGKELKTNLQYLNSTELKLVESEKMAAIGTLTTGICHEINNPLNFIKGSYVALSKYVNQEDEVVRKKQERFLKSIDEGANRITEIVKSLNMLSNTMNSVEEEFDLNETLNNCIVISNSLVPDTVKVIKEFNTETIPMKGNNSNIHQVFLNIYKNAIQAISEDGKIIVRSNMYKDFAIVEIIDNGVGIEKDNINKLVEPFYTTRPPGEGTGLGLTITYNIIKEHNGSIEFESQVNIGTKVIVKLPLYKS